MKKQETEKFQPLISVRYAKFHLVGTSPLITHAWDKKAKRMMLAKQQKEAGSADAKKKEKRNPEAEYEAAKYKDANGDDAFLAIGIKKAMTRAANDAGFEMVFIRRVLFSWGVEDKERIAIIYDKETDGKMRMDMIRLNKTTSDLRFRPGYEKWECDVILEYNESLISLEQVRELLALAGYSVGLCEWRPERDGIFGRFSIADEYLYPEKEVPDWG